MSTSNAAARTSRTLRATRGPRRPIVAALAGILVGVGALTMTARAGAQTPTITTTSRALTFGSVLPGGAVVTVKPWQIGDAWGAGARSAAIFLITGPANGTVYVKAVSLPSTIENGTGGVIAITGYTMQFNTVLSSAGAITLSAGVGVETAVTLNAQGQGFVSVGATVSPSVSQPKGGYAFGEGGVLSVR